MTNVTFEPSHLYQDYFTAYHFFGAMVVYYLQFIFHHFIFFFDVISKIAKPGPSIYFLFPIGYFLGPHLGLSVFWSIIIAEAINSWMKLLIRGDRPYWWVKENSHLMMGHHLHQYRNTCESTNGTPSAHVLVLTAALTTIFILWCECEPATCSKFNTKLLSLLFIILLCISRVVLATHFPHQVIISVIIGLLIAYRMKQLTLFRFSPLTYLLMAFLLFGMGALTEIVANIMKICPIWAIGKALNNCNNQDWVKKCYLLPYITFIKLGSLVLGAGISIMIVSSIYGGKIQLKYDRSIRYKAAAISLLLTSILYTQITYRINYDLLSFLFIIWKSMMVPFIVIVIAPLLIGAYED